MIAGAGTPAIVTNATRSAMKGRKLTAANVEKQRKQIGAELKRRRMAMKLTQEAAASMAGITRKDVAAMELGRQDHSIDPFIRYCAILGSPILPVGFDVVIRESAGGRTPFEVV